MEAGWYVLLRRKTAASAPVDKRRQNAAKTTTQQDLELNIHRRGGDRPEWVSNYGECAVSEPRQYVVANGAAGEHGWAGCAAYRTLARIRQKMFDRNSATEMYAKGRHGRPDIPGPHVHPLVQKRGGEGRFSMGPRIAVKSRPPSAQGGH